MRFFLSYGGGMPSHTCTRSSALAPRCVLWGSMLHTLTRCEACGGFSAADSLWHDVVL